MSLVIDTGVKMFSEVPPLLSRSQLVLSAVFLRESSSSAQPNYVDDVCILVLSNRPKGRNHTAQDRVTVRTRNIAMVRDDVPRNELPQVAHCSLCDVHSGPILLEPNVLDISSKLVQLQLQEIFQHFSVTSRCNGYCTAVPVFEKVRLQSKIEDCAGHEYRHGER